MGDRPQALPRREEELLDMPPGFRFHPTDLEIVVNYLEEKVVDRHFTAVAIGEADLNSIEPWDLPSIAKLGEKEWYFFWQRDRKYPTGSRTNRATESGYWKATGKDKEIYRGKGYLVGMKKTLVFYLGRAPRGKKTSWVMHEYRLEGRSLLHLARAAARNDWVVCRVFHKNEQQARRSPAHDGGVASWPSPTALPPLLDSPCPDTSGMMPAPYAVPYPHEPLLFHLHQPAEYMEPLQLHQECKIEDYPLHPLAGTGAGPCEFTLNLDAGGGASFDGPGSPSSSAGPLGDLDNIWSY